VNANIKEVDMLVIPLTENDLHRTAEAEALADYIELRLDTFSDFDNLPKFTKPLILTLRTKEQGGHFSGTHEERLALLEKLAPLKPAYIDIEYTTPLFSIPGAKIICSYHNFSKTPEDLDTIYERMHKNMQADIYKIATHTNSVLDLIRLLAFVKRIENVAGMCMGEFGPVSRVLAPICGSTLVYACLPDSQGTAPGQIDAKTLIERYGYPTLNRDTRIYGLIGSPVEQSYSDITHNAVLKEENAVYVKLDVRADELTDFCRLKRQLPFYGFSVTTPHKQAIGHFIDLVDEPARGAGAINTLYLHEGEWHGTNTDIEGATTSLEKVTPLAGKKVVVIGAGGAARAIAFGVKQKEGEVTITNRTMEKATVLAKDLLCASADPDNLPSYDILINATCAGMAPNVHHMPIDAEKIQENTVVMDAIYNPRETRLLQEAARKNCQTISGIEMFIHQAAQQLLLWFPDIASKNSLVETISSHLDS